MTKEAAQFSNRGLLRRGRPARRQCLASLPRFPRVQAPRDGPGRLGLFPCIDIIQTGDQERSRGLSLLEEALDADLAAIGLELQGLKSGKQTGTPRQQPKRAPLPPELPRIDFHHEPDSSICTCGCERVRVGEDISEKLDYTPGVFTVERHIRGKWACKTCETLVQAAVPPHVIDKGIPTTGLLAQVLVAKYSDHLPLYRQERIFARAGLAIAQSTLGAWVGACGVRLQPLVDALREEVLQQAVLHADETPVQMLAPGKGKTHRAYLWAYSTTQFSDLKAVIYDFAQSRAGEHARAFLGEWRGKLTCDDYGGYKASFQNGVTETGCLAQYPESRFMSRTARLALYE
ncbi:transposase [Caballeronia temeraria]|uniref:Transposase n=1 Tax=Caballeronia temeraria TaxID=1777137 RepID=A0A158AHN4_9BURK|nr:transposase [Caballeronia temeraria]